MLTSSSRPASAALSAISTRKGARAIGKNIGLRRTTVTTYRITEATIFPSTADSASTVGTPAPYPEGSEDDSGYAATWEEQAGDLSPQDIIDELVGTEFEAVDLASMKARLAALRNLALTGDPSSTLGDDGSGESAYSSSNNGEHRTVTAIGYVDGEGHQVLTGTYVSGQQFYVYLHLRVQRV